MIDDITAMATTQDSGDAGWPCVSYLKIAGFHVSRVSRQIQLFMNDA